jgi:hypothetical protein
MRVDGTAVISMDAALIARYPEAQFVVRVEALHIYPNCPRYIHKRGLVERSAYVPRDAVETPVPDWKKAPWAVDVLPGRDARS